MADFSHTKNNRVDGVINPSLDPLYEKKLELEKKLLDKKYQIEDARLDMYLKKMSLEGMQQVDTPRPEQLEKPVKKPVKKSIEKKPEVSVADQIYNLYR